MRTNLFLAWLLGLAVLSLSCQGGPSSAAPSCGDDLLACPELPPCGGVGEGDAGSLPEPVSAVLDEPHPTGHRGLVGVLDRSKAIVSEDGTIQPEGLHPLADGDTTTLFRMLPEGVAATWELAGPRHGYPVAALWTSWNGLRYEAVVFGAPTDPPGESILVTLQNPSDQARTATLVLGLPDGPGPFAFDGMTGAQDSQVRFLIRPDPRLTCVPAGNGVVSCSADLPPRSGHGFDVFLVNPGGVGAPAVLPCADDLLAQAIAGWDAVLAPAATVSAADPWLGEAFRSSLVHDLLMRDKVDEFRVVKPGAQAYDSFWFRDAAYIIRSMDSAGLHARAEESLRLYWNRPLPDEIEAMGTWNSRVAQYDDGRWECPNDEHDGTGQALWALVGHYQLTGDLAWLRTVYPAIRNGANWLVSARLQTLGGENAGSSHEGLLPIGCGESLIPWDYVLNHNYWGVLGLRMAGVAADAVGEAGDVQTFARAREALQASVEKAVQAAFIDGYIQAAPGVTQSIDHGSIGALYPCEVLPPDDALLTATFENMWQHRVFDQYKFPTKNKIWTYITADWAQALLLRGEWERATTLFEGYRKQASPVAGWWEEVFVDSGVGTGDDPHGWAAANYVLWLRSILMWETAAGTVELLRGVPPAWLVHGSPLRATGFPLRLGRLESLVAEPDDAGGLRVQWDLEPKPATPPTVVLFARGRLIDSVDCGSVAGKIDGDHVSVQAAAGTCTMTLHDSPPGA